MKQALTDGLSGTATVAKRSSGNGTMWLWRWPVRLTISSWNVHVTSRSGEGISPSSVGSEVVNAVKVVGSTTSLLLSGRPHRIAA